MIRKESQYVICANCKSTLLIEKDVYDIRPPEYYNLTPKEYYLLLAKENSFNPKIHLIHINFLKIVNFI